MKKSITVFLLLITYVCSAQSYIQYSYDASGNRIKRQYIHVLEDPGRPANNSLPASQSEALKYRINVFPNPTSAGLNITISKLAENDKAILLLYDMQGREVIMKETFSKTEQLDISSLHAGNYFLKVIINGDKASYKIQKLE